MNTSRTVIEVGLKPLAGSLFQPTGFPDLGPAEFGDGNLLVESAQSMANWLEGTTWDPARSEPAAGLAALPYVRIVSPDGAYLTSSRVEAHRLACAYIMDGTIGGTGGPKGREWLPEQLGLVKGRPLDNRAVARACFRLDPLSLVHGVFFAQKTWPWQPRVARALTSFIEASGIQSAISGGVKRDSVLNEGKGFTDQGYGSIPHHRVEYTAKEITAYFAVDHAQLRSYGLSEPAVALLQALADFEIATLLDRGLRLRTRCDLVPDEVRRGEIPDAAEAAQRIAKFAADCEEELGQVTTVTWSERTAK